MLFKTTSISTFVYDILNFTKNNAQVNLANTFQDKTSCENKFKKYTHKFIKFISIRDVRNLRNMTRFPRCIFWLMYFGNFLWKRYFQMLHGSDRAVLHGRKNQCRRYWSFTGVLEVLSILPSLFLYCSIFQVYIPSR